jgi:hypothetical protein
MLVVREAVESQETADIEIAAELIFVFPVAAEAIVAEKRFGRLGEFVFESGAVGGEDRGK